MDFVAAETLAAGPSPNLKMIGTLSERLAPPSREQKTWLACCYAAIYNTSGAASLYTHWTAEAARDVVPSVLESWIEENRPGMPVHSNRRRTHGSPRKMAEGLQSLAEFALSGEYETYTDYDRLWEQVHGIDNVGRYFGIKLAGTLHELNLTRAAQYDIRGSGAKNGRRTLALLFPKDAELLDMKTGGNSQKNVQFAERTAQLVKLRLEEEHGLAVDWFQLEALLCEFNQMVKGHRYAGKTSDADCDALHLATTHFGEDDHGVAACWRARRDLLPPWLQLRRKRDALLDAYSKHGYVWSDAVYDWERTEDPARPALKSAPDTDWVPLTRPEEGPWE